MDGDLKNDPRILMQRAKEGDANAFSHLYELYFVPVFRYIYARVSRKEDAEDLVQTVFLNVYKSIAKFQEKNSSPLAYFFSVARNAVIDHWRKRKEVTLTDPESMLSKIPDTRKNPQELAQEKARAKLLHQAISHLRDEQQEVIVLKFINGFSNKEIAHLLSKTEAAIRQLQCRALKTLLHQLQDSKII